MRELHLQNSSLSAAVARRALRGSGTGASRRRLATRAGTLVAALSLLSFFLPAEGDACSVCLAGDPIFDAQGSSAQAAGSFSAYLEVRGWKKRSDPLPHDDDHEAGLAEGDFQAGHENHDPIGTGDPNTSSGGGGKSSARGSSGSPRERNRGREVRVALSWTPIDRLTLTANLPFRDSRIIEDEGGGADSTRFDLSGIGDASFHAGVVAWRNRDVLPSTWLELRTFVKTPTGKNKTEVEGVEEKHLQPGTGSWDFGFGTALGHRLSWGELYGSAFYRLNTEGSWDYRFGDAVLANASLAVPLGHATGLPWLASFTPGFELNYRWAAKDRIDGDTYAASGGHILYATPSLRVKIPWFENWRAPSIRAAVQLPLTSQWLNDFQHEQEVWSVGLLVPF